MTFLSKGNRKRKLGSTDSGRGSEILLSMRDRDRVIPFTNNAIDAALKDLPTNIDMRFYKGPQMNRIGSIVNLNGSILYSFAKKK